MLYVVIGKKIVVVVACCVPVGRADTAHEHGIAGELRLLQQVRVAASRLQTILVI